MAMVAPVEDCYSEHFAALQGRASNEPKWLHSIREAAFEHFHYLGFPNTKQEMWRKTNVASVARTAFIEGSADVEADPDAVNATRISGLDEVRLVFVDGRFSQSLSSVGELPDGVAVKPLSRALVEDVEVLHEYLTRFATYEDHTFTSLNTAFVEDGIFVHVRPGRAYETPIYIQYVSTAAGDPIVAHPRNLIIIEKSAQATVIEDYVSLGDGVALNNVVTEVVARSNSTVELYELVRENTASYHISTLRVQQDRDTNLAAHSVQVGGALVRKCVHPVLAGEGCDALMNGLFVCGGDQHVDNHMRVEHAKAHCESRQVYKGILNDNAHGVFNGRIIVHPGAQKTDAKQSNMNLLLADTAQMDTNPELEIYADDVKCTHGATVGQIDEDAVFYLQARGINRLAAQALLLYAFAGECLGRMKVGQVREAMKAELLARLPEGNLLAETIE